MSEARAHTGGNHQAHAGRNGHKPSLNAAMDEIKTYSARAINLQSLSVRYSGWTMSFLTSSGIVMCSFCLQICHKIHMVGCAVIENYSHHHHLLWHLLRVKILKQSLSVRYAVTQLQIPHVSVWPMLECINSIIKKNIWYLFVGRWQSKLWQNYLISVGARTIDEGVQLQNERANDVKITVFG